MTTPAAIPAGRRRVPRRPARVAPPPWGRFDDLAAGRGLIFAPPHRILSTDRPGDVAAILAEVQAATDGGDWAFGYLAYEAASGLDQGLNAHLSTGDGLPLAWFGLSGAPEKTRPDRLLRPPATAVRLSGYRIGRQPVPPSVRYR